ncbi:MAG TPA: EamA family transporter [Nocardioidaceae bacterium]|nr:EamA family transporter [Nocardioidaceae bacterium]
MSSHRSPRIGVLQVATAGVLWGTGGLVMTVLHDRDGLDALTVSAWRMGIAAMSLLAFALVSRRGADVRGTLREHPVRAIAVGVFTAVYQGLYFVSVLLVGVSVSTVLALGLAPVLATAWEHVADRTRPSGRQLLVLAAALTGLVLISFSAGDAPGDHPELGILLAIGSGVTYAATTLVGRHVAQRVDAVALTTCATAAGACALAPFIAVAAVQNDPVGAGSPASWALLVYLGVATMAVAYGLLYAGLRSIPGSAATVATLVEPLSAVLLAVLLLDERLSAPAVLGCVLILAAVAALRPEPGLSPGAATVPA